MKKLLFVPMSLLMLTGTIVAQSQQTEQKIQQNVVEKNDHFLMEDGKMLHVIDGKGMQMQNDMTLKNGTMIKLNGSYQLSNGKQLRLRNGQCMDMNGSKYRSERVLLRKTNPEQGMKMQSGSPQQNKNGSGHSHH